MERLTAEDRLILWPDEVWPQDVGALAVLDGTGLMDPAGRFRIEHVREAIEGRLHLVPRFRQVLRFPRRGLGGPLWVDAGSFDLSDHLRTASLPAPGGEAELLRTVEELRRRRLDRSRPLWEMWFLTGLPDARIGLFVRLHHVVADGIAGMATLGALLDAFRDAPTAPPRPWEPTPAPSERKLFVDNLQRHVEGLGRAASTLVRPVATVRRVLAAWPAMGELLAGEPGPRTSLDRVIGPNRTLGLIRSRLDFVKGIAHANGAKVNDVLLAAIAGGLRGLLDCRGEHVEGLVLPIYVPVSLRRDRPGGEAGNLISQMVVHLPVGIPGPGRRLRQIATETARRKAIARPSLGTLFGSRIVRGAMLKLIARQRVNLVTADLPGPPAPLYLAGAQLLEVFPLVNLLGNESLGVGALSYAGQFNAMVVADADAYPDLDVFVAGVRDELRALAEASLAAPDGGSPRSLLPAS